MGRDHIANETYSELLKSCPEVGILQHSMGESCSGKSCLFVERRRNLDFWKISRFLNLSCESSVYMVFYESLNLTGNGLFEAKTSVYLQSSLDVYINIKGSTCLGNASFAFCGVGFHIFRYQAFIVITSTSQLSRSCIATACAQGFEQVWFFLMLRS